MGIWSPRARRPERVGVRSRLAARHINQKRERRGLTSPLVAPVASKLLWAGEKSRPLTGPRWGDSSLAMRGSDDVAEDA